MPSLPTTRRLSVWSLFAIGALTLLACGASERQVDRALPYDVPDEFSGESTSDGRVQLADAWWTVFEDPALSELIERGLRQSLSLRTAWLRVEQANAAIRRDSSALLPTVDADASVSQRLARQTDDRPILSVGVSARYEVDIWGRIRDAVRAQELELDAREHDAEAAAISLSAQIAETWYQLAQLREQLELIAVQRDVNRAFLELVELRFGLGLVDAQDVLRQRRLLESSRSEEAALRSDIEAAEHRLAILLGEPPASSTLPGTPRLGAPPPLPEAGLPTELLQRRPDVLAALARIEAADARTAVAAAERFPRLTLSASANTATDPTRFFVDWIGNLVAGLTAPIFEGGRVRAEVDRAELVAEEAVLRYGEVVLTALKEVEDALARNRWESQRIESLQQQRDLAQRAHERARARYASGTATFLTVLDATTTHQQIERTLVAARGSLMQHRIDLCRALAGDWSTATGDPIGD